jgi:DNA polymerase I-like protein with 3'-5' exonuclease and polymerase domains
MKVYEPYSLIHRARKFVGKKNVAPRKTEYKATKNYELITGSGMSTDGHKDNVVTLRLAASAGAAKEKKKKEPGFTQEDFLAANEELAKTHSLIYKNEDAERVAGWLATLTDISADMETYGTAKTKAIRKKEALSFVRGRVRLVQLSSGTETYFLDTMLLSQETVGAILKGLKGKTIYFHNASFDVPRLKHHFGIDLSGEDIRDTMVLSRLARAGEWVDDPTRTSRMRPFRHDLKSALVQEGVAEIPCEVDHRWDEPLNEPRIRYARDDVLYLKELHDRLMDLVEERNQSKGLELFKSVYPVYLRMQYRGVPFDVGKFKKFQRKLNAKIDEASTKLQEHQPEHPEGGQWSWGNKQPFDEDYPFEGAGRNGARRALSLLGIALKDLKKPTRREHLKAHPGEAPLLEALDEYYRYSDIRSGCKDWLRYYYEDGRLYPNVKPFSQETGRSAYSDPPLQNIPKDRDEYLEASLRDCIRTPEGYVVVKADYAAQELRILAELAGDESLVASFYDGKDPHVVVGEQIVGHELKDGTEEYDTYRKLGKRANYGFSYGAGPARYAQSVYEDTAEPLPIDQARAEQKAFQTAWTRVKEWQQEEGSRTGAAPEHWYTESFVGRRRYVDQKKDKYSDVYKPSYCDRLNGPVQSGGADMLYVALAELLQDKETGLYPDAEILFTTHDEIVLEAPKDNGEVKAWLETCMQKAARRFLRPELTREDCVDAKVGPSWGGR